MGALGIFPLKTTSASPSSPSPSPESLPLSLLGTMAAALDSLGHSQADALITFSLLTPVMTDIYSAIARHGTVSW